MPGKSLKNFPLLKIPDHEPRAVQKKMELIKHGIVRSDPYFWLKNRNDPEVLEHLRAEMAYTEQAFEPIHDASEELFQVLKKYVPGVDESVPVLRNGYFYYHRYEENQEFPVYYRLQQKNAAQPETLIDVNLESGGYDFFQVGQIAISDDNNHMLWSVDTVGRRQYSLRYRFIGERNQEKHHDQGRNISPHIDLGLEGTSGTVAWAKDSQNFYYAVNDKETLRTFQIYRACLKHDRSAQTKPIDLIELVYEEKDLAFRVGVYRSRCRNFVAISCDSTLSNETFFIDAADPKGVPKSVIPRSADHLYYPVTCGKEVFLLSNLEARNFKMVKCDLLTASDVNSWTTVIAHRDMELFVDFEIFDNRLVALHRKGGIDQASLYDLNGILLRHISFQENHYHIEFGSNPEFHFPTVRLVYSSMTIPSKTLDVDLEYGSIEVKKTQHLGADFNSHLYTAERIYARAREGLAVAISLVYKKGACLHDGKNPLLLYGYGSYGETLGPHFSLVRLPLIDRGFVYAIAHIRGSETFGRDWYETGKLLDKKNTFNDFIDCAEHLIMQRYCRPDGLYAMGGSAGGLLMGAVMNERPELFAGIVAAVPFVDVVTTMLDDSIPLTTFEYDEWGNPHEKDYFEYMLSYSPYDNTRAMNYPPLLVTTGLHDSQVQYWEPAKWVAKIREVRTNKEPLFLKIDMSSGHGGKSGRYENLKDVAFEFAFILSLEARAARKKRKSNS